MSLAGESNNDTRPVQRSTQRVPPHNLDAESSLLGAMLLSRDAVASALERGVLPDEFYKPIHRHIFDAIRSLNTGGEPVDAVTVAEELRRAGTLDTIGGLDALLTLQNATPAITSADRYAKIVRDTARLRRLIGAASDIAEIAFNEPDDVDKAIDDAESKIFDIGESHVGDNAEKVNVLIDQAIEKLQTLIENKGAITGVPTGIADLDKVLLGLQPGTLNILGARPAMGKSAFALNLAVHAAQTLMKPVLFFSLEMGKAELAQRILSSEASVDGQLLRTGRPSPNDWTKISHAVGRLDIPLTIDDSAGTSVGQIRAKARRTISREGGLALIVIDYLQLMGGDGRPENRQLEVSEISRKLKLLAREFSVPVLALSQLSRQLEARTEKRPTLSDLRESGALEQDADVVMFLFRPEIYDQDPNLKGKAEINVAKHRAGPLGTAQLAWLSTYTRFQGVASDPVVDAALRN
jgi:replicative DNA helicase